MLKEALQYLVSLKSNQTYDIDGSTYSDHELFRIKPHIDRPESITVTGLDSIVKLIKTELKGAVFNIPIFIRIHSPRMVHVFSTLDYTMARDHLYRAESDTPVFNGGWNDHDAAIIAIRSMFIPNEDSEYLLDLLSRISKDDGVQSDDNGVSQTVTTRSGVSLKNFERVKPRVSLAPYRTFLEVEQPTSEFILRISPDCRVGLIEADGGAWKLEAKKNICAYFEEHLSDEISDGKVVVML